MLAKLWNLARIWTNFVKQWHIYSSFFENKVVTSEFRLNFTIVDLLIISTRNEILVLLKSTLLWITVNLQNQLFFQPVWRTCVCNIGAKQNWEILYCEFTSESDIIAGKNLLLQRQKSIVVFQKRTSFLQNCIRGEKKAGKKDYQSENRSVQKE